MVTSGSTTNPRVPPGRRHSAAHSTTQRHRAKWHQTANGDRSPLNPKPPDFSTPKHTTSWRGPLRKCRRCCRWRAGRSCGANLRSLCRSRCRCLWWFVWGCCSLCLATGDAPRLGPPAAATRKPRKCSCPADLSAEICFTIVSLSKIAKSKLRAEETACRTQRTGGWWKILRIAQIVCRSLDL